MQVAPAAAGVTTDDAAPSSPVDGQLWYKSDSGNTYIWYTDPNTSQWVQVNVMPATGQAPVATAQTRNRIVNGAMQISQEWGNTATGGFSSIAAYVADQWVSYCVVSPGTLSGQRVQAVTPNGSKDRTRLTVGTAKAALSAGDEAGFFSPIEGNRVADFRYGSASARQVIVRFGWKSPAGTYSICIGNGASDRSYVANFTVSAGQANTNTVQTFVILGDVTGAWATDTSVGLYLYVMMACGTSNQGVAGWQAGYKTGSASNTNGMATAGNTFELYDVGLYLDPQNTGVAPAWQMPDEAEEIRACQRYYEKPSGAAIFAYNTAGNYVLTTYPFKVTKRVVPSIATPTWTQISNAANIGIDAGITTEAFCFQASAVATGTFFYKGLATAANARM